MKSLISPLNQPLPPLQIKFPHFPTSTHLSPVSDGENLNGKVQSLSDRLKEQVVHPGELLGPVGCLLLELEPVRLVVLSGDVHRGAVETGNNRNRKLENIGQFV